MPPVELIVGLVVHLILPAMGASGLGGVLFLAAAGLPRRGKEAGSAAAVGLGLLAGNWLGQPIPYLPSLPDDFGWRCLLPVAVGSLALSVIAALVPRRLAGLAILAIGLPLLAACVTPA